MKEITAKKVVLTSLVVDLIDIIANFIVAIFTGSIVMKVETIQGFTDLFAVILLLVGLKAAKKTIDHTNPFGTGRNLYFWTLLSSIFMLTLTATVSFYLGLMRFIHPEHLTNLFLAYGVLILAIVTNGYALSLDIKRLSQNLPYRHIFNHFLKSPHIETKTTFVLDLIGVSSASVGLLSLIFLEITGNIHFDGIGAMIMGIILALLSFMLIKGAKELLIGKSASRLIHEQIRSSVNKFTEVRQIKSLKTIYIGSGKLLILLDLHLINTLSTDQIEKLNLEIKNQITKDNPSVGEIQIELA